MPDKNVDVTPGDGATIACDGVTDPDLGGDVFVQYVKLMDGALGGKNKANVFTDGCVSVSGPYEYGNTADMRPFQIAGLVINTVPLQKENNTFSYPWLTDRNQLMVAKVMRSQMWFNAVECNFTTTPKLLQAGQDDTWIYITTLVLQNFAAQTVNCTLYEGNPTTGGVARLRTVLTTNQHFALTWPIESPLAPVNKTQHWYAQLNNNAGDVWVQAWGYKWTEIPVMELEEVGELASRRKVNRSRLSRDIATRSNVEKAEGRSQ